MMAYLTSLVALTAALAGASPSPSPASVYEIPADPAPQGKIDELVFAGLKQSSIRPAKLCSDQVFVRRVYLDAIGTLPTADEVRHFLADRTPNKRSVLIDRLLERKEFADYWAMRWGDLLRVKAEFPIKLWPLAAQAYHHWIRTAIEQNKPYDQFVWELLTESGSNFRVPQVNFYRAMQDRGPSGVAQTVALTFMGTRADAWPKGRLSGMAAFFSQIGYKSTAEWKEEIVFFDPGKAAAGADGKQAPAAARFPDGTAAQLPAGKDPRKVFADWLIQPDNPWFTRNIVNRIWCWLLGRGIVHEPDDLRPDNPPTNPELLAWLERELVAARYDLKHIHRLILNSTTYQRSSIFQADSPEAEAKAEAKFAFYPVRRLDAEVLIDALNQITGTKENYSSNIPEPYTFIPEDHRTIALADGSISSPFLGMFGRPSRDTGLESERNNRPTAAQSLHLLNSSHMYWKVTQSPRLEKLAQSSKNLREVAEAFYLTILSRFPMEEELKTIEAYSKSGVARPRDTPVDLAWALINSAEFLHRH